MGGIGDNRGSRDLLRDLKITTPNQVWACDITDVPMPCGDLDLTAVIDWFSRHVLSW